MVMGVIDSQSRAGRNIDPDAQLQHPRILITGVASDFGLGLARALAGAGCRVVLDPCPDARMPDETHGHVGAAIRSAQRASEFFGGIDACINLVRLPHELSSHEMSVADCDEAVVSLLRGSFHAARLIAGRMRLTRNAGLILNVVIERRHSGAAVALASFTRAAIGAMTRPRGGALGGRWDTREFDRSSRRVRGPEWRRRENRKVRFGSCDRSRQGDVRPCFDPALVPAGGCC